MRIALGRLEDMVLLPRTVPGKVYLHLEMCCGCITTSASGLRERTEGERGREAEHLPIYLTKIYVSIQGDERTGDEGERG